MAKAILVPPLGFRWVEVSPGEKRWARRIISHGGTCAMTLPVEVRKLLGWERSDMLILAVQNGMLFIRKVDPDRPIKDEVI